MGDRNPRQSPSASPRRSISLELRERVIQGINEGKGKDELGVDHDIKHPAKGVLNVLAFHVNDAGEAWPSVKAIAASMGVAENTARTGLRQLVEIGIIAPVATAAGGGPVHYRLIDALNPWLSKRYVLAKLERLNKRGEQPVLPLPEFEPLQHVKGGSNGAGSTGEGVQLLTDIWSGGGFNL